jgi:hypothetical protein
MENDTRKCPMGTASGLLKMLGLLVRTLWNDVAGTTYYVFACTRKPGLPESIRVRRYAPCIGHFRSVGGRCVSQSVQSSVSIKIRFRHSRFQSRLPLVRSAILDGNIVGESGSTSWVVFGPYSRRTNGRNLGLSLLSNGSVMGYFCLVLTPFCKSPGTT